jgi:uncharacterized membrane protein SpoIIM required for sporulation
MRQDDFVVRYEPEWRKLELWLDGRGDARAKKRKPPGQVEADDTEFPGRYRRVCQHRSIAQRRGYSPIVLERLEQIVQRGHHVLYRPAPPRWHRVVDFFAADFPRQVRRHRWYMLVSALLLFVPMIVMIVLLQYRPELVHTVFGPEQIRQFEAMYDPASPHQSLGRESGTNLQMFGLYIWNNISIDFRTFASGLLGCVGAIFVLVFNGVYIGTVAGHLTEIGYGGPFWRFVCGHSAPELGSAVLSGGAGLRIGWALIAPGQLSRLRAVLDAARDGVQVIFGVFCLSVLAAFIEAYWSSIMWMPSYVKFSFGGVLFLSIMFWFWRGGRGGSDAA